MKADRLLYIFGSTDRCRFSVKQAKQKHGWTKILLLPYNVSSVFEFSGVTNNVKHTKLLCCFMNPPVTHDASDTNEFPGGARRGFDATVSLHPVMTPPQWGIRVQLNALTNTTWISFSSTLKSSLFSPAAGIAGLPLATHISITHLFVWEGR